MAARPLVSVIVPAYNSADYIRGTLATVVGQTSKEFELIVSDDGSEDNTVETARTFLSGFDALRWQVLTNDHAGPGATRNAGVRAAEGEWVAFLDSDDLWLPTKIEQCLRYAASHPAAAIIAHDVAWLTPGGRPRIIEYHRMYDGQLDPFIAMWRRPLVSTSAVLVKRQNLIEAGLFDPSLPNNQDYDLWLRLTRSAKPEYVADILSFYIRRPDGISNNHERRLECMLRIYAKYESEIAGRARVPAYERRRFRSKAYFSSARALIRQGDKQRGLRLLSRAVTAWLEPA